MAYFTVNRIAYKSVNGKKTVWFDKPVTTPMSLDSALKDLAISEANAKRTFSADEYYISRVN